jgi:hypothetical protein
MTRETATRTYIAALVYLMTNSVLFGAGVILVLTWPALSADAGFWITVVVATSFILAAPIAWWIAPRMRARYWRRADGRARRFPGRGSADLSRMTLFRG